jgi:hypothetical protein
MSHAVMRGIYEDAKKVIFMELYLVRGVAWEWNLSTSVAFGGFLELE